MDKSKAKLYLLILTTSLAGYIYLYIHVFHTVDPQESFGVCLIKEATNIPCPSCGSTRAVLELIKGNLLKSLYYNPFGIIVAAIMTICPFWILIDLVRQKETFYSFYKNVMEIISKPRYAFPLILLVIINWIWNIHKYI
jgi:hypothetical protein